MVAFFLLLFWFWSSIHRVGYFVEGPFLIRVHLKIRDHVRILKCNRRL